MDLELYLEGKYVNAVKSSVVLLIFHVVNQYKQKRKNPMEFWPEKSHRKEKSATLQ